MKKVFTVAMSVVVMVGVVNAAPKIKEIAKDNYAPVTYSVIASIETNKVDKDYYVTHMNTRTWIVNADSFPNPIAHEDWVTNVKALTIWGNLSMACTNSMYISSANQTVGNAPDPFEEKVTVSFFVVVSNAEYWIHVGPLDAKYSTQKTVINRWYKVKKQKISMSESEEIKKD